MFGSGCSRSNVGGGGKLLLWLSTWKCGVCMYVMMMMRMMRMDMWSMYVCMYLKYFLNKNENNKGNIKSKSYLPPNPNPFNSTKTHKLTTASSKIKKKMFLKLVQRTNTIKSTTSQTDRIKTGPPQQKTF